MESGTQGEIEGVKELKEGGSNVVTLWNVSHRVGRLQRCRGGDCCH